MYQLKIHRQVIKKLERLPSKEYQKVSKVLRPLAETGDSQKMKKLSGKHQGSYRLRIGNWRLLLTKDDKRKVIYLLHFGPRGDIYH